eukprot:scaffold2631_cov412-Prasinococcus_capsulatus_cf.AAC.27
MGPNPRWPPTAAHRPGAAPSGSASWRAVVGNAARRARPPCTTTCASGRRAANARRVARTIIVAGGTCFARWLPREAAAMTPNHE